MNEIKRLKLNLQHFSEDNPNDPEEKAKQSENDFCWAHQRMEITGQTAAPKSRETRQPRITFAISPPGTEATDW